MRCFKYLSQSCWSKQKQNALHKKNLSTESSGSDRDNKEKDFSTGKDRSNSALIARSLGLAQTPPSAYGKIGGPGVGTPTRTRSVKTVNGDAIPSNGRNGSMKSSRSATGSVSSNSGSSGASVSMYSRTTSASALAGRLNDVDFDEDMDT